MNVERLIESLLWKRPHGAQLLPEWVRAFIIDPIYEKYPPVNGPRFSVDAIGNLHYRVEKPGEGATTTLFSAHLDTVHAHEGKQSIAVDGDCLLVWKEDNEPLGADNAAGCWMLVELVLAGVPGHYIWHQGEERGGIGSSWIQENRQTLLQTFNRAVAFDRRKDCSIITEMSAGVTCSDAFAEELAARLDLGLEADTTGSFTDTANYRKLIPECTNISVGYDMEHTPREVLDLDYLLRLRDAAVRTDWETLPTLRDHLAPDPSPRYYWDHWYDNATYTKSKKKQKDIEIPLITPAEEFPAEAAFQLLDLMNALDVVNTTSGSADDTLLMEALQLYAETYPKEFDKYHEALTSEYLATFAVDTAEWDSASDDTDDDYGKNGIYNGFY